MFTGPDHQSQKQYVSPSHAQRKISGVENPNRSRREASSKITGNRSWYGNVGAKHNGSRRLARFPYDFHLV